MSFFCCLFVAITHTLINLKFKIKKIATAFVAAICFCNLSKGQDNFYNLNDVQIKSLEEKCKTIYLSDPEKGLLMLDSLYQYYKHYNKEKELNNVKIIKAHCYSVLQKEHQAMSLYEDASKYFLKVKDSNKLFRIYSGIGIVYSNFKEDKKAAYYFKLSIDYSNDDKEPENRFNAYTNYGSAFYSTNQLDTVRKYYDLAYSLLGKLKKNQSYVKSKIITNYAYLNMIEKNYESAISKAKTVLEDLKKGIDIHYLLLAYEIIGLSYLNLHDHSNAERYIDSMSFFNKKYNSSGYEFDVEQDYYKIDSANQNHIGAIKHLKKILILKDSLNENNKINLTKDLLIKYETEKKELENKTLETENSIKQKIIFKQKALILITVLLSICLIVVLYFFFKFKTSQQKKLDEKEKISSELKALKAQLNPHFIQNIFQIIANQVLVNPNNVSEFLQKTSTYLRSALNNTEKQTQTLEDEIIFSEKYLQFQQSIFENRLTYEIHVEDSIDSFGIILPSMILQPFLENSIKYGLQSNENNLHISLNVTAEPERLKFVLKDNGINVAIKKSANDQSFGNSLILKRLTLFYKNKSTQPSLDSQPLPNQLGYVVTLTLPLH